MPTPEADAAVLALLDAVTSPVALDAGKNLFLGPMIAPSATRPQTCVTVSPIGGACTKIISASGVCVRTPVVRVEVRSDRADYDRGLAITMACFVACGAVPSGYTDTDVDYPAYRLTDQVGRHNWSFNVRLLRVD